jgi:hypothetical protein
VLVALLQRTPRRVLAHLHLPNPRELDARISPTARELLVLGVKVAPSTVWQIPKDAKIDPAPARSATTWAAFLRSQADAPLAYDFFETVILSCARLYVFAVIEHTSRRIWVSDATAHPTAAWVTQATGNPVMERWMQNGTTSRQRRVRTPRRDPFRRIPLAPCSPLAISRKKSIHNAEHDKKSWR